MFGRATRHVASTKGAELLRLIVSKSEDAGERLASRYMPAESKVHSAYQRQYRRRRLRRFLAPFVSRGDLVFDIGANVGEWSVVLRSLGCSVVAVEPQSAVASRLMHRFARDSGVVVVPMAVAAAEGEVDLHYADTSSEHASASTHWMGATMTLPRDNWSTGVETVHATTIDNLIRIHGHPRFCKIDVEGFELQALQGLSESVPILQFEFHYEILDQLEACLDRVCTLGSYRFNVSIGERPKLHLGEWAGPETLFSIVKHLYPTAWGDVVARAVSD